jgi:hypothetical protein
MVLELILAARRVGGLYVQYVALAALPLLENISLSASQRY